MEIMCRICLSLDVNNDINELPKGIHEETKTSAEIMLFCVDIMVKPNSNISTKLCSKCYLKIIDIYKFKKQALINDEHMKRLELKNKVFLIDEHNLIPKCNNDIDESNIIHEYSEIKVKSEEILKEETFSEGLQSEDELLSVLKNIKYEYVPEEIKENVSSNQVKKKRGRKKYKTKEKNKPTQVCEECGKAVRNMKDHMTLHMPKSMLKKYQCSYCDKVFVRSSARHKHIKFKHLGYKEHCQLCNKDVVCLKAHNMTIHDVNEMKYECDVCGRRFISPSRVKEHIVSAHTKERPFPCDTCEKAFRTKQTMLFHKRQVHDKEKSHLCQICSKSFFKKYHLIKHIRSHTKEKPYECKTCGKWYSCSTSLRNHQLTHTTTKEFQCKHCDMMFTTQKYLRRHMMVHTKEKKYPCKYCGVCFGRSDHQKRHQKTAHERHLVSPSDILYLTKCT